MNIINICLSGESGARNQGWPDVAQETEEWPAHLSADQEYASQEYLRPPAAQEYASQEWHQHPRNIRTMNI
jgi:hypothetical protein